MKNINLLDLIERLDEYNKTYKGFLPIRTPVYDLSYPYDIVVDACENLPKYYDGEEKNCRNWLDKTFSDVPKDWIRSLGGLSNHELESLLTKVSLLCHAYRWGSMPALKEEYERKSIVLPKNLELLWKELSLYFNIPMAGNFYTMVSNNWINKQIKQNETYDPSSITALNIEVMHTWLDKEHTKELKAFIMAALGLEAQGEELLKAIQIVYTGINNGNSLIIKEGMLIVLECINKIVEFFNDSIKLKNIHSTNFLKYIQPTMIWLIDDIEGANGTQSCTMQALDSFFDIKRESSIGKMITRSREYIFPHHMKILRLLDNSSNILYDFIKTSKDNELIDIYNNCLKGLEKWRKSHKNKGARYLKGEKDDLVDHYVSTGLAVELNSQRDTVFKDLMQSHIYETTKQMIEVKGEI